MSNMGKRTIPALLLSFALLLMVQALFHWRAEALFPSYISALPTDPGRYPTLPEQIERLQRCLAYQPGNAEYRLLLAERLLLRSSLPGQSPEAVVSDLERARTEIAAARRLRPIDPRGPVLLGRYLLERGRTAEALIQFRQASSLAPSKGQVQAYLAQALVRAQAEEPEPSRRRALQEEARLLFRRAALLDPSLLRDLSFLSSLADLHSARGEGERALRWLQQASSLPFQPESYPILLRLASLYLQQGEAARAVGIYRSLLARPDLAWQRPSLEAEMERASLFYPSAWPLQQLLGDLAASRKDWGRAAQHYRRWAELQPRSAEAHFQLGLAYQGLGRQELALAKFTDTLRLDAGHRGAISKLVEHYRR